MPSSNAFLPYANYPGSSGYVTGETFPSIYSMNWDPVSRTVRSANPNIPGYDQFGRLKGSVFPSSANASGVNPYSTLGGYSPVAGVPNGNVNLPPTGTKQLLSTGGYNPTAAPGQGYNPFFTVSNTKSPDIAAQINDLLGRLNGLKTQDPTQMVTDAMKAADPAYKQYLGQETGAVGNWYNGDIQSKLDALRAQRGQAFSGATNEAKNDLSRILALGVMGQGGSGTLGTNSWVTAKGLDTAAHLNVQRDLDAATQGRTDLMTLLQGQQQNLGTRAGLTTSDIQRQLLPSQVSAQWFNNLLTGLGGLSQLNLGNTFYGLGKGTTGQVGGNYDSLNFPGVGGGVQNSPRIPMSGSGGGGGGYGGGGGGGGGGSPYGVNRNTAASDPLGALRNQILAEAAQGNYSTVNSLRQGANWNPQAPAQGGIDYGYGQGSGYTADPGGWTDINGNYNPVFQPSWDVWDYGVP